MKKHNRSSKQAASKVASRTKEQKPMHPSQEPANQHFHSLKQSSFSVWALVVFSLLVAGIGVYLTFFSGAAALRGDINNDGKVDIADLSLLLSSYGGTQSNCRTNTALTCDLSSPADGKV